MGGNAGGVTAGEPSRRGRLGARLTAAQLACFLDTLAATGNVTASAKAAGGSIPTYYGRRRIDRAFAEAWEAAKVIAYERLEEAMLSYAAARFVADPEGASAEAVAASLPARLAAPEVSRADVEVAMQLLNRGLQPTRNARRTATPEQSDAAIRARLDAFAKKLLAK